MEAESRVFGKNAESIDENENYESEEFNINQFSKEEAEKNIEALEKDLTDFIDSFTSNVPDFPQEDIDAGIEKVLEKTRSLNRKAEMKPGKSKKITLRVLFIAALLSMLSVCGIYAVGNSYDISIENGFVSFAKDTIKIVFFDETEEKLISVDTLMFDLKSHGYGNLKLPQEFVINSVEYEVSIPEYFDSMGEQIIFDIYRDQTKYTFNIFKTSSFEDGYNFLDINDAETIVVNGKYVYLFTSDNNVSMDYFHDDYHFYVSSSTASYDELVNIAETIG